MRLSVTTRHRLPEYLMTAPVETRPEDMGTLLWLPGGRRRIRTGPGSTPGVDAGQLIPIVSARSIASQDVFTWVRSNSDALWMGGLSGLSYSKEKQCVQPSFQGSKARYSHIGFGHRRRVMHVNARVISGLQRNVSATASSHLTPDLHS